MRLGSITGILFDPFGPSLSQLLRLAGFSAAATDFQRRLVVVEVNYGVWPRVFFEASVAMASFTVVGNFDRSSVVVLYGTPV